MTVTLDGVPCFNNSNRFNNDLSQNSNLSHGF
ncbi:MAG: hypothetical protein XD36_1649 [Halomonas sp. 54_146]|nr:MAG: hypothetical protein XD36_1649 [Halomonas sp. 54_146]